MISFQGLILAPVIKNENVELVHTRKKPVYEITEKWFSLPEDPHTANALV
jgi:hypothetical protein